MELFGRPPWSPEVAAGLGTATARHRPAPRRWDPLAVRGVEELRLGCRGCLLLGIALANSGGGALEPTQVPPEAVECRLGLGGQPPAGIQAPVTRKKRLQ